MGHQGSIRSGGGELLHVDVDRLSQSFQKVIADSQCVCDDRECWIDCGTGGEEAAVYYIEVVEFVGFAVGVEDGLGGVGSEANGSVLMSDTGNGNLFAEIDVIVDRVVLDANALE